MWARWLAILAVAFSSGCGSETGIVISVTKDSTVTVAPSQLQFIVGVADQTDPALFVEDPFDVNALIDVSDRDLGASPYRLLLRDAGSGPAPSTITVAVLGLESGQRVAFAGMPVAQTFMPGSLLEYQLVLHSAEEGVDYDTTATGCFAWGNLQISSEGDLDCDSCDDATGSGDECNAECAQPSDCPAIKGDPPCGAWACESGKCKLDCPNCTDADMDGYGVGDGCAGGDCDDDDRNVTNRAQRPCYTGPDGTLNKGVCRAGAEVCTGGVWSQCSGEVTPGGEACNGDDDDCDDMVDEDLGVITCGTGVCTTTVPACTGGNPTDPTTCVTPVPTPGDATCDMVDDDCDGLIDEDCGCILVAPGGDDTSAADNANATPFGTVQAAIDWAAADTTRPQTVCISSGDACGSTASFSGAIKMANGVSVLGRYDNARNRCPGSSVTLKPGSDVGVEFPSGISAPTVLEGVKIERHNSATTAGITMTGATNVVIRDVEISNTPLVTNSFGINMSNGSQALITRSSIWGGNGAQLTVGIRSKQSRPTIRDNCSGYDARGRCDTWCDNGSQPGIRGRYAGDVGNAFGVLLEDSPDALIETSAICGNQGANGAAIRVQGEARGTIIRTSFVAGWGAAGQSHGIWLDDCDGDSPQIVDNADITGEGRLPTSTVNAIRSVGECHPVIDSNVRIVGGSEGGTTGTTGIYCGKDPNTDKSSHCTVLSNYAIIGSQQGTPPFSIGVRCDDGACARIADNNIDGRGGLESYGVWLDSAGPVVENNQISGGCGTTLSVGVKSDNAWARLQNNRIFGGSCNTTGAANGAFSIGLWDTHGMGTNELDVHSNNIDGDGYEGPCDSVGIKVSSLSASGALRGAGIYRNNIIRPGRCVNAYGVEEGDVGGDPRVFEHNDIDAAGTTAVLYRDENLTDIRSIDLVNALIDMAAVANISVPAGFVSYPVDPHLSSGSLCIGAGTPMGAPAVDMDGDPRDPVTPDIGADEF